MAMVEARSVEVTLHGQRLLPATTFALEPGSALAVRGPNGAGKTTLLRVFAGMLPATSGGARVDGRRPDARDRRFRRVLGALVGPPPLARDLTLREHLAFVAASWGADAGDAGRSADALLDELGLRPLAERFPHELSSGQTQLFCLALVLARPAEVLLLDEPEQRLDADRRDRVAALLGRRRAAGTTLLFATHSDGLARVLADDTVTVGAE